MTYMYSVPACFTILHNAMLIPRNRRTKHCLGTVLYLGVYQYRQQKRLLILLVDIETESLEAIRYTSHWACTCGLL